MKRKQRMDSWRIFQWLGLIVISVFVMHVAQAQPRKQTNAVVQHQVVQTPKQAMSQHTDDLRALMLALYERHPEELAKSTQVGAREMTEWVFDGKANWKFDAIRRTQKTEAIALIFDPDYTGDHILALVVGLETLLFNAYGGKNEYEIAANVDEKPVLQAACQLEGLQKQLDLNVKRLAVLSQPSSRQLIQHTLQAIIQRIREQYAGQLNASLKC